MTKHDKIDNHFEGPGSASSRSKRHIPSPVSNSLPEALKRPEYDPSTKLNQDRKCDYCGHVFNIGNQGQRKHCSRQCRQNHYVFRKTGRRPVSSAQIDRAVDSFALSNATHKVHHKSSYFNDLRTFLFCLVSFLLSSFVLSTPAYSQDSVYFNKVVDAIYLAEGGTRAVKPFGILSVPCEGYADCRKVCYNTVRNNWRRWEASGKKLDYITFLGNRYCPVSDPRDVNGLNKNWIGNVRRLIK